MAPAPLLLHLNGPPGIGKSTLARRWVDEHSGTLCCDIDVLRTMVGGWRDDFVGTGELVRTTALAMIGAYLSGGHDVVLPQLITSKTELARFAAAAVGVGATYRHVLLTDARDAAIARFYRRADSEPHLSVVRDLVELDGGSDALTATHRSVIDLAAATLGTVVVRSVEGEVGATYAALLDAVRSSH